MLAAIIGFFAAATPLSRHFMLFSPFSPCCFHYLRDSAADEKRVMKAQRMLLRAASHMRYSVDIRAMICAAASYDFSPILRLAFAEGLPPPPPRHAAEPPFSPSITPLSC
jgi:hypothetical protein